MSTSEQIFEPVESVTLVDQVIEQIELRIRDGSLKPASRLPSERELSRMFNIGRPSIREALQNLQARGLVEIRSGRGTYVRDPSKLGSEPFKDWEETYSYSISELMEVRLAIEPLASSLAAERASTEDLKAMELALARFRYGIEEDILAERVLADTDFHMAIMKGSENRIFMTMMDSISYLIVESRRNSLSIQKRLESAFIGHQTIFERIVDRDAESAAESMRAHLIVTAQELSIQLPRFYRSPDR